MKQIRVRTKSGKIRLPYTPTFSEVKASSENMTGFCIACGHTQRGVEPDAERYTCEACDKNQVWGGEQLLTMGHVVQD